MADANQLLSITAKFTGTGDITGCLRELCNAGATLSDLCEISAGEGPQANPQPQALSPEQLVNPQSLLTPEPGFEPVAPLQASSLLPVTLPQSAKPTEYIALPLCVRAIFPN
jgi:hypothetical protein